MKVIGYNNKFYTLWDVTTSTTELNPGKIRITTTYNFIRNLSKIKETAFEMAPGIEFIETLDSRRRCFSTYTTEYTAVDTFRYGKYNGKKIAEVNDLGYTSWYWETITDENHKKFVMNYLCANGYETRTCYNEDGTEYEILVSPEDIEKEIAAAESVNAAVEKFENGETFEITPDRNINSDGDLLGEGRIVYHFNEFKYIPETYYAPGYTLPVLGGHAKRIKNKTVIVTEYTHEIAESGEIIVNIINFKIAK